MRYVFAILFVIISTSAFAGSFSISREEDPLLGAEQITLKHDDIYKGICANTNMEFVDEIFSISIATYDCSTGDPAKILWRFDGDSRVYVDVQFVINREHEKRSLRVFQSDFNNLIKLDISPDATSCGVFYLASADCTPAPISDLRILIPMADGREAFADYDFSDLEFREALESVDARMQAPFDADALAKAMVRHKKEQEKQAAYETASFKASLVHRFSSCLNTPIGAREAGAKATLTIRFNPDGSVNGIPDITEMGDTPLDTIWANASVKAVMACAPYSLVAAKYDQLKEMSVVFDATKD